MIRLRAGPETCGPTADTPRGLHYTSPKDVAAGSNALRSIGHIDDFPAAAHFPVRRCRCTPAKMQMHSGHVEAHEHTLATFIRHCPKNGRLFSTRHRSLGPPVLTSHR